MNTTTKTLTDHMTTEQADAMKVLALGFAASIDSADEITMERFTEWFRTEQNRIVASSDSRHPMRKTLAAHLAGTYDEFRATA